MYCKRCGKEIEGTAMVCENCNKEDNKEKDKKLVTLLCIVVIILLIVILFLGSILLLSNRKNKSLIIEESSENEEMLDEKIEELSDADSKEENYDLADKDDSEKNSSTIDTSDENTKIFRVITNYNEDDERLWLDASSVKEIELYVDENTYSVVVHLDESGAKKFEECTTENVGEMVYILNGDMVLAAPRVQTPISGGTIYISIDDQNDAEEYAALLQEYLDNK